MEAIDILMNEHRQIERVLGALKEAVVRARRGETLPVAGFVAATEFISALADERHHQKEEHILFEAMSGAGMPKDGPISVMMREHELARHLVTEMKGAVEALRSGESAESETLLDAAENYVAILAQHIIKEDHVLYPISMQLLSPGAFDDIARQFREVDSGRRRSFEEVASEVVKALGPIAGKG